MGNHMDSSCYLAGLVYQDKPVVYLRPFRSNTMQITSFGKEFSAHGIRRNDDFSLLITFKKVSQASCMVAMPMRNENIVHVAYVHAQQLCILDKHVTCSGIKQDLVQFCLQQNRQSMLCG